MDSGGLTRRVDGSILGKESEDGRPGLDSIEWAGNKTLCATPSEGGVEVGAAAEDAAFGVVVAPGFTKRADHDFGAVLAGGGGFGGGATTGSGGTTAST